MKTIHFFFLLFSLLICSPGIAEEYTFTNKADQKQITAEVKSIASGKVAVEKDGQTFQIPVTKLIDEDVTFLKQWLVRNPTYAVRIMVTNKKGGSPEGEKLQSKIPTQTNQFPSGYRPYSNNNVGTTTYKTGAKASSEDLEHFQITIINDSTVPLADATINYTVSIRNKKSKEFKSTSGLFESRIGTIAVPLIQPGKTAYLYTKTIALQNFDSKTITTTTIEIENDSPSSTYNSTDKITSSKSRTHRLRPEIDSITVNLHKDGKLLKKVSK